MDGRKRHLLVDTTGFVMKAYPADLADREGARLLLDVTRTTFPRLGHVWADAGYREAILHEWVSKQFSFRWRSCSAGVGGCGSRRT